MKLSIPKSELLRGLSRIQSIVEKRNTMPILANVLLEAKKDGDTGILELAATDLEVGIRSSQPADVQTAGSVTASAKKLYEIVRELPEEPVHIEVSADSYLTIKCARAQFSLAGNSAEEYPTLPTASPGKTVTVQPVVLSQMIERTMYAASADETRYNLNGVFIEQIAETGKLRMVATDGHRLSYVDRDLGSELEGLEKGVIIPRKGLSELKKLVDEEDADEIEIGFEGNNGLVRKHGVTLVMRLIEGEFPNYRQVIPKETTRHLVLNVDTLSHALRRVALLSSERSRAVKFELSPGLLKLSSNNPDLGEAHEELDIDYDGEELTIAFNARYLMDCLAACAAKEVRLSFQDELSPTQLVPTTDDDSLAVVMPMRV
jgi:DNA polymerase-3 subunit beta